LGKLCVIFNFGLFARCGFQKGKDCR
jgi:hypothetical protein